MKKIILFLAIAVAVTAIGCTKATDLIKKDSKKETLYFRVESVDKDGKIDYTRVITIKQ